MNFTAVSLEPGSDVLLIRPRKFVDQRGYFLETWSRAPFAELGIAAEFIQDNESLSSKSNTVRGLHFQGAPFEQAKLVRVLKGAIYDVALDIRPSSRTFGRWLGAKLTSDHGEQLFVPRGYAHGFMTLGDDTIIAYKVDAPYSRESEGGIRWDDPELAISWPVKRGEVVLSDRDAVLPSFRELYAPSTA